MEEEGVSKKERKFEGITIVGKILLALAVLFYITGFLSTNFLLFDFSLRVFENDFFNAGVLVLGIFLASIAFYGMLSPLLFFLLGIEHAGMLSENILLAVKFVPFFLAGYAGILVASFVRQDSIKPLKEWKEVAKTVVTVLAVAIVLAFVLEYFTAEIAAIKITIFE